MLQVVSWVLLHQGTTDPKLAEYCTAAVASLSYTPVGAQRLGAAGVIDGLSASMSAFLESSVDLQIYGCLPRALPVCVPAQERSSGGGGSSRGEHVNQKSCSSHLLRLRGADACAICASCAAFERLARNPVNRALIQASMFAGGGSKSVLLVGFAVVSCSQTRTRSVLFLAAPFHRWLNADM